MTAVEKEAIDKPRVVLDAIQRAIEAYGAAGFGSHVTDPLRHAAIDINYSIREVTS